MHWIECLVYKQELVNPLLRALRAAHQVPLQHGFVAVPIDEALLQEFAAVSHVDISARGPALGEEEPEPVPAVFLESVSRHHPVAWVRTRYFGGTGEQAAGVWENGCAVLGPLVSKAIGPINAALQRIGVPKDQESFDEFESVGLGEHREFQRSRP